MKKIFTILFSLISISLGATTWYIDPDGSDATGNGTAGNPWYSLSYACSQVSATGDRIFVNAGSYTDNNHCTLVPGVSIEGDPYTPFSNITTSYVASGTEDGYIVAASPKANAVNGNQSISYIRINGNSATATRAIYTAFRSNVIIHHCTFTDFKYSGVYFNGTVSNWDVTPTNTIPTGNEIYNCTFTDCTQRTGNPTGGQVRPEGQNGMLIHDNTFDQRYTLGENGDTFAGFQNEGLQIYNNIFYRNSYENGAYNWYAELHYNRGGFQLYNNTFNGFAAFDFSCSVVGTWDFGGRIYDNSFIAPEPAYADDHRLGFVELETYDYENDIYVYRNYFKNAVIGVHLNNIGVSANYIWIYDNIFEDIGNTRDNYSYGIKVESNWGSTPPTPTPIDNLYIYNNVIDAGTSAYVGIHTYVMGTVTNQNIRNNIITGNFDYPILFDADQNGRSINTLNINNNIFYACDYNSIYYTTEITYTGRNDADNLVADPLFVGGSPYNFHLSGTGSPAYHAGMYVSLPTGNTDYDQVAWNNPPSRGAYEYGGAPPPPPGTGYARKAGKYVMKFGKIIRR